MATENISDAAPTTTPPSDAGKTAPAPAAAQGTTEGTISNGWGGPALNAPPTQEAAAPSNPAPASAEQAAPTAAPQAAPAPSVEQSAAPAQDTAAAVEGSTPTPAPTGNREQLHRRVQSRLQELEEARSQLAGQDHNKERARAIDTELQVARDAMNGGWEHVGPIEAAHLSQWLTNTGYLVVAKPAAEGQN